MCSKRYKLILKSNDKAVFYIEAEAARNFLQAWTLFFTVDCLRIRMQQNNLASHIRVDLMARDLQDAREAIEPLQERYVY